MALRYSMFSVCDHYPDGSRSVDQWLAEILDEIVLAEELGYHCYWVAEHHFHEYGIVTNPAQFLAVAAERTSRILLGPAVTILPFRNPILVAEDYAFLDRISGGRLVMGVGSGYLSHEFDGFGLDGAEKRERFDAGVDILKRAWAGERIEGDSPGFSTRGAELKVLPLQRPTPPIYVAVLRREAAYHVGRQGNRMMTVPYATLDGVEEIGALLGEYREGLGDAGHDEPDDAAPVALHAHVAETDDEARAHAARPFDLYVETRLYTRRQVYDGILRSGLALFGSVETVTDQLVELHELGLRHVMLMMNFGSLSQEHVHRSMRLMAEEVVPRVAAHVAPN